MKKVYFFYIALTLFSLSLYGANEIDNLLANIEEKSDLSLKTKQENTGVSYIYTKHDLDIMQAKYLSDVLKSTEIGYKDSRYGIIDPFNFFNTTPFSSSMIKVFIDNEEISSALYGSGLPILGDMELGFVDHIEIYAQNPTFAYSTEPSMVIIRIYSKEADRDIGGKITTSFGSYKSNLQSFQYADTLDKYSYLFYLSRDINRKKNIFVDNVNIKRNIKNYNLFASIYDDKNRFMLKAVHYDKGGLFGISLDAKPDTSDIKTDNIHLGYERNIDKFNLSFIFDKIKNETVYKENILNYYKFTPMSSFYVKSTSEIYTTKASYICKYKNNKMILGDKLRLKHFVYNNIKINGVELPRYGHTKQLVNTVFVENNYNYTDNAILTAGISYSHINNNGNVPSAHTLLYRLGHTFLKNNWVVKTYFSHIEMPLDPYLINSIYAVPNKMLKTQKINTYIFDIKYSKNLHSFESILGYLTSKDYIMADNSGLLDNSNQKVSADYAHFRWIYKYAPLNKLITSFIYRRIYNIPVTSSIKMYNATIRNLQQFDKFDAFEELVFDRDNVRKKSFFDLSIGVKYHLSDNFSIALKGTNLFDKAIETSYKRWDSATLNPLEPVAVSSIDRKIILTLEWYF